ncbi:MAG: hypothetical protein KGZ42_10250 [Melioribacter sp.]|nr:hypothetical protein [Melioribacter sp.]
MILLLGTLFLSLGIIYVLHSLIFSKIPKSLSYFILFTVVIGMFATLTVHGIWLGLTILIFGVVWLKNFYKRSNSATS